ncbi:MAG: hypothetical protein WC136_01935 [Sphaerochaeta sp.]|jgi:hypothetical protein
MKVNKFNPLWQIARLRAKEIKNVNEKIKFIMEYLERNKNIYDKNRVENWLKTTRMAYKATPLNQLKFDKALTKIPQMQFDFNDNNSQITDLSLKDAKDVLRDLKKRKYNFQFNKAPQDHIEFVAKLEEYINTNKS